MGQLRKRQTPVLVKDGHKTFISTHRWSDHAVLNFIREDSSGKWIDLGEIAKVAYGHNTASGRDRVRRNLPKLFRFALFGHQTFLITQTEGPHDKAISIKHLNPASEDEVDRGKEKLARMRRRKELSDDMYYHAMRILEPKR